MAETAACLTEDQIEQLLQEAEARLTAKASAQNATSLTKPAKLDVAKASSPAQPAKAATAAEEAVAKEPIPSSELAFNIPPPRVPKKDRVCYRLFSSFTLTTTYSRDDNFPLYLEQRPTPVMGVLLHSVIPNIIVTLTAKHLIHCASPKAKLLAPVTNPTCQ